MPLYSKLEALLRLSFCSEGWLVRYLRQQGISEDGTYLISSEADYNASLMRM